MGKRVEYKGGLNQLKVNGIAKMFIQRTMVQNTQHRYVKWIYHSYKVYRVFK